MSKSQYLPAVWCTLAATCFWLGYTAGSRPGALDGLRIRDIKTGNAFTTDDLNVHKAQRRTITSLVYVPAAPRPVQAALLPRCGEATCVEVCVAGIPINAQIIRVQASVSELRENPEFISAKPQPDGSYVALPGGVFTPGEAIAGRDSTTFCWQYKDASGGQRVAQLVVDFIQR